MKHRRIDWSFLAFRPAVAVGGGLIAYLVTETLVLFLRGRL